MLAYDNSAIGYFTSCAERRLRWVLDGLATDLQYLEKTSVGLEYVEGTYRRAGMMPTEFADAPAPRLWCCLQIIDTRIRKVCQREDIGLHPLPTAGTPWCFRGRGAVRYAAFVALSTSRARSDAGLPSDASEAVADAPVVVLNATA